MTNASLTFPEVAERFEAACDDDGIEDQRRLVTGQELAFVGTVVESELVTADLVIAGFDSDLGYPTDIYIDSIANAIDDELTIVVAKFEETR